VGPSNATLDVQVRSKQFDQHRILLRDVDLRLQRGSVTTLLGPSGSGKTTLLKIIAGLDTDFDGQLVAEPGEPLRVSMLFQDARLLPWLRVRGNIDFGLDPRATQKTTAELLELVGLPRETLTLWPRQLSGGMARRVALARALAVTPDVLLLDEPFSSIDEVSRVLLHTLLIGVCNGKVLARTPAVVMVTHDMVEAARLSSRVVIFSRSPPTTVTREVVFEPEGARFAQDQEVTERVQMLLEGLVPWARRLDRHGQVAADDQ
jgi:ABC-type nitrate/sulfonate/bicarbonate transport system ATPase subunit